MDSRVARLQARADSFLFQPFFEIYTKSHFSFQIVFLTLKLRNRLIFPFNLSIRFSNAVGFLKLAPNREYPTPRYACFLGPLSCPKVAKGRSAGGAARQKRRAEFAYWNQTEASFVSRHTGKSTVRSQPGNEGNGRLATKRRSSFSTNLGLCRAPSEVQLRIRGRFV